MIHKVKADAGRDEGVAYFYCNYSRTTDAQTPEVILASFSYQLIRKFVFISVELDRIYRRHLRENTKQTLQNTLKYSNISVMRFPKCGYLLMLSTNWNPMLNRISMEA